MIQLVLDAIGNLDNVAWCMSREMTQEVEKYMRRLMGNLTSLKTTIQNETRRHRDDLALAEDGIRIALKIAGFENVDTMTQFERASAILNMAQELAALTTVRVPVAWANGRGYNERGTTA